MSEENQVDEQEAIQNLYNFIAAEMQAGSDKTEISRKLVEQGVDRGEAEQITRTIYDEIVALVQKEQFSASAAAPGLLGGVLAALLGGGIWAGIAVMTDYELGIIAWAIGGLCGFGVVLLAQGRKGAPLQVIAVLTSVFGILVGKYFTFYYILRQAMLEEYGEEAVAEFTITSMNTIQFFVQSLGEMVSGYDALWVILAVITAWRIPKGSGISLPSQMPQGPITPG
jgi:hypothetical protein